MYTNIIITCIEVNKDTYSKNNIRSILYICIRFLTLINQNEITPLLLFVMQVNNKLFLKYFFFLSVLY